jgi:hypothetical protein
MTRIQRQTLVLSLGNYVLLVIVALANHALAPWQMRLWLGGLLVAPAALNVGFRAGATAAFLSGLAIDALAPVWFGSHALLLLAAHAVLYSVRDRVARAATAVAVVAALFANLGLFLLLAFFFAGGAAGRLLADLLISQAALALVAPWFFAFQLRALALAGAPLRMDER